MEKIKQVLIIENSEDLPLMNDFLSKIPFDLPEFTREDRLAKVILLPATYHPDLIFLDINLPDSTGLETYLTVSLKFPDSPIIILSDVYDSTIALQAIQAGAQDYIVKGDIDERSISKSIRYSVERKKIELKLRESEARYRLLVENAPEALVVFDVESRIFIRVSESAVKLFKMGREELMRKGPIDVSPKYQPDGRLSAEAIINNLTATIKGGKPTFEWTHMDADGREIPCEVSLVRLPSDNRTLIRGSITDITERKKGQEALRNAEETRKLIMNAALDAIICMDLSGHIISWSPQAERIFGWKEEEVNGKTVAETIIPPELRERHDKGLKNYIKTGKGPVINKLIVINALDKSGRIFPVELTITHINQGNNNFFCAFLRDITENEKIKETVRVSHERLKNAELIGRTGYWHWNVRTTQITWSEGTYRVFGEEPGNFKGTFEDFSKRIVPEDKKRVEQIVQKVYDTKTSVSYEFAILTPKGERKQISTIAEITLDEKGDVVSIFGNTNDITEYYEAQQALKASEDKYRSLIEQAGDSIALFDSKGRIIDVNQSATELLGYSKSEFIKLTLTDVLLKEELLESPIRFDLLQSGESTLKERRMVRKDGSVVETEVHAKKMANGDFLALIRDLTERKKAELALQRSNERFELIARTTHDAIWEWNLETGELWANEIHQQLFGLSLKDPVPLEEEWKKRIHPDDRANVLLRKKEALSSEKDFWETEYRLQSSDGSYLVICDRTYMIRNKAKKVVRLTGNMIDITAKKKAEEEIRRNQQDYASLVNTIDGIVWEADAQTFQFSFVSHQAERLLGYPAERWIQESEFWKEHIHEEERKEVIQFYSDQTTEGKAHQLEYRMLASDGRYIWLRDFVTVVFGVGEPTKLRGIMVDITESKQAEIEIIKMHDRLKHISQATNDAIWDHDLLTGEIWWNDKLYELYGIDPKGPSQGFEAWEQRLHPDDKTRVLIKLKETQIALKPFWQDEYRFRLPDGSYAHLYDRNFYLYEGNELIRKSGSNLDITALKKAEETLINNELRFRTLTGNAPVGIFQADINGNTIYVNETWMEFADLTYEEAMGLSWVKAIHPNDQQPLLEAWNKAVKNEDNAAGDFRFVDKKGNTRWVSGDAVPLYNQQGEFTGYIGTLSDITERKRSEVALRESEERYRSLVDQAVDAIIIFEETGQFIDVNRVSCVMLGYSKEELKRMQLREIIFDEDLEDNPIRIDLLKKGESVIRRRRFRKKDNSAVEVEVHSKRLPDGRFLGMVRDLTERMRAEKQIEKEKELSDNIIESLPGIFYLVDSRMKFLRWNKNLETVSGYSGEEVARMHPLDFFSEGERALITEKITEVFSAGLAEVEATVVTSSQEKLPYYLNGRRVIVEDVPCIIGVGIDISDRKKSEEMIRETTEQLRQLSGHLQNVREEERIEIAREIHDELGQQLTVLKMDISWLQKKVVTKEEKVLQKMNSLMELIDGTVRSVRKISSDLRPSMLDDLGLISALEWHSKEFGKRAGFKINFKTTVKELELPVETATAMFRIFQESLTNVARHAQATSVNASLAMVNDKLQMLISDNGIGFSEIGIENKKTLGILGMRERVLLMKGDYEITSKPGLGTTVKVLIPLDNNNNRKMNS